MFQLAERDLAILLSTYGYWAVLAFVGLESVGVPLPGETMLIAAALYAGATHQLWLPLLLLAAAAGAILGDNLGYAIGTWGGYPLLVRYGRYLGLDQRRVKLARYLFLKHGGKVVFFGRFVTVLRYTAAWAAGIARMRWWKFLFWNAAGGICWATGVGLVAYYAGNAAADAIQRYGIYAAGGIAVAVVIGFFFTHFGKKWLERRL